MACEILEIIGTDGVKDGVRVLPRHVRGVLAVLERLEVRGQVLTELVGHVGPGAPPWPEVAVLVKHGNHGSHDDKERIASDLVEGPGEEEGDVGGNGEGPVVIHSLSR